jgi:hypothetical protein
MFDGVVSQYGGREGIGRAANFFKVAKVLTLKGAKSLLREKYGSIQIFMV